MISDGAGNLYVGDGYTIRKVVTATGAVTTIAGAPGQEGSTDGVGAAARFYGSGGIASDGAGNLYVTDTSNDTIRKFVIATGAVTTIAGKPLYTGSDDGTGAAARFAGPAGIVADGAGNLYVVDMVNCTIRKVVIATGAVTTIAGKAGQYDQADGTGAAARFGYPEGMVGDAAGNLYVADTGNGTIRKVVIATGAVTTIAGSRGSADGTGAAAGFYEPRGIVSDGAGNLYVTDSGNQTIRKVAIATAAVTTIAGAASQSGGADGTGSAARFASRRASSATGRATSSSPATAASGRSSSRPAPSPRSRARGARRQHGRGRPGRPFQWGLRHRRRRGGQPLRRRDRQQQHPEDRHRDRGGHHARGRAGEPTATSTGRRGRPFQRAEAASPPTAQATSTSPTPETTPSASSSSRPGPSPRSRRGRRRDGRDWHGRPLLRTVRHRERRRGQPLRRRHGQQRHTEDRPRDRRRHDAPNRGRQLLVALRHRQRRGGEPLRCGLQHDSDPDRRRGHPEGRRCDLGGVDRRRCLRSRRGGARRATGVARRRLRRGGPAHGRAGDRRVLREFRPDRAPLKRAAGGGHQQALACVRTMFRTNECCEPLLAPYRADRWSMHANGRSALPPYEAQGCRRPRGAPAPKLRLELITAATHLAGRGRLTRAARSSIRAYTPRMAYLGRCLVVLAAVLGVACSGSGSSSSTGGTSGGGAGGASGGAGTIGAAGTTGEAGRGGAGAAGTTGEAGRGGGAGTVATAGRGGGGAAGASGRGGTTGGGGGKGGASGAGGSGGGAGGTTGGGAGRGGTGGGAGRGGTGGCTLAGDCLAGQICLSERVAMQGSSRCIADSCAPMPLSLSCACTVSSVCTSGCLISLNEGLVSCGSN